jgi:hypothetical protein
MSKATMLGLGLITVGASFAVAGLSILAANPADLDHDVGYGLVVGGVLMLIVGSLTFIFSPSESAPPTGNANTGGRDATQNVAGRDIYINVPPPLAESLEGGKPNVVFDGFSPVDDEPIQWAENRISRATLAEFARVQFANEPERGSSTANIDDLHARIEIKDFEGKETLLTVKDGNWFENADRGEGPGRDTKSTNLPCNGETRTLDVVMRPHGVNECHGWNHNGFAIPEPAIPTGEYQVWIELDASAVPEKRHFRFLLVNPQQVDKDGNIDQKSFIGLRELEDYENPRSRAWASQRERTATETKHHAIRDAIAAIDPLVDEGNRILDSCGRPASQMRGADPMYFIDHCIPKINRFAQAIGDTIREVAPEYSGKVANIGNVTDNTDHKPAMIQQVERWLVKLEAIQDALRARLP